MSLLGQKPKLQKVCFVTVGATASFDSLIKATLSPPFLEALKTHGYTNLRLQHGKDGQKMLDDFEALNHAANRGEQDLSISGFDFNKQGLGSEMQEAKSGGNRIEGVVVSHAGSICFYPTRQGRNLRGRQDPALSSTLYGLPSPLLSYPIQNYWIIIKKS